MERKYCTQCGHTIEKVNESQYKCPACDAVFQEKQQDRESYSADNQPRTSSMNERMNRENKEDHTGAQVFIFMIVVGFALFFWITTKDDWFGLDMPFSDNISSVTEEWSEYDDFDTLPQTMHARDELLSGLNEQSIEQLEDIDEEGVIEWVLFEQDDDIYLAPTVCDSMCTTYYLLPQSTFDSDTIENHLISPMYQIEMFE